MRYSRQREAVYNVLASTTTHPEVQWIYNEARKIMPNISLGTVYRNLGELVSEGRAMRICVEGDSERYDARAYAHPHFACVVCGAVSDVDPDLVELSCKLDDVTRADIMLYGVCEKCKKTN